MKTFNRMIIAAALTAAVVPTAAHAQFGGLVNKAKEKVAQKGAEAAAPVAPGEQLTDELLGKVLAGASAADRVLAQRDNYTAQRLQKDKELSALVEKNRPVLAAYNQANEKSLGCRDQSFSDLNKARGDLMAARTKEVMSDPKMMGKMQLASMKYAKAMSDAQKNNDPVALQKAQSMMMAEATGMDVFAEMKKDTAKTDAKCGKSPAMPASMAQEEKLRSDISDLDGKIRTLEAQAVTEGAKASGMDQVRYLQLKERAGSILARAAGTGPGTAKFGDEETAVVKKHQAELDRLKRAM